MIWKDILTYCSIRPATFHQSRTPNQIIIARKGVPSICLGFLIGPTNYSMIYGWWITTRRKRVLVVSRAWDGRAARKVFSFQFSGFESLAIPPPKKQIWSYFYLLKRKISKLFQKSIVVGRWELTQTNSLWPTVLFILTSGYPLIASTN